MDEIWKLVIAVVVSPVLLLVFTSIRDSKAKRQDADIRRAEKQEEYARLDLVAERAEDVATKAEEARKKVEEAAELLVKQDKKIEVSSKATAEKLDVIHTLVDGSLTASMKSEFHATRRELVMMKEVMELKKDAGREPSPETLTAIQFTEEKVLELQEALAARIQLNGVARAQMPVEELGEENG